MQTKFDLDMNVASPALTKVQADTTQTIGTGIGASPLRKEDARHLYGKGQFVGDLSVPRLWEAAFVRSQVAHARIIGIEKPAGLEDRVFVSSDMDGVRPIRAESTLANYKASNQWVLAKDKVRFVGECIAICIAPTRAQAEDIAEQVKVNFESLPPVIDCLKARRPESTLLHEEWGDNLFLTSEIKGDLTEAKAKAAVVIKREYHTARQCMVPLEGKGVLAYFDERFSQLVVHTSTQVPHLIRTAISECLNLDQAMVRVIAPDVGGGFGYKCVLQPEEVSVSWLAKLIGRPLRWVEDRREHLVAGANSREHHYAITAYADDRGKILGLDAEIMIDIGAYSVWPFTACLEPAQAGGNLPGPYALEAYQCRVYSIATNKPAFTPYRGVARPGVCFAIELTMDAIARAVGRDPIDVRCINFVPTEAMPYTNVTGKYYDSGDYSGSLRRAQDLMNVVNIRERQNSNGTSNLLLGVGFATFTEQTAHGTSVFASWGLPIVPGYEQATLRLTPTGTLELRAGIHTVGQGLETTLAQVASEYLGIDICHISVILGDTALTPYSTGAYASRGMVMAGGAVAVTAEELANRIKNIAASLLECVAVEIKLEDGQARANGRSISIKDVAEAWYLHPDRLPEDVHTGGLEVTKGYKPDVDTGAFTYASHGALVGVDEATGVCKILDYVVVEDCGQRVNPLIVNGQAFGGTVQGIGTALFEESLYDSNGQPLCSTFVDYLVPGAAECPEIRIDHMETLSPFTKHGIKGVGESAAIAPSSAIVNAINDALKHLGVEINQIPATPKRILSALLAAKTSKSNISDDANP